MFASLLEIATALLLATCLALLLLVVDLDLGPVLLLTVDRLDLIASETIIAREGLLHLTLSLVTALSLVMAAVGETTTRAMVLLLQQPLAILVGLLHLPSAEATTARRLLSAETLALLPSTLTTARLVVAMTTLLTLQHHQADRLTTLLPLPFPATLPRQLTPELLLRFLLLAILTPLILTTLAFRPSLLPSTLCAVLLSLLAATTTSTRAVRSSMPLPMIHEGLLAAVMIVLRGTTLTEGLHLLATALLILIAGAFELGLSAGGLLSADARR